MFDAFAVGLAFTVTTVLACAEQLFAFVATTVYEPPLFVTAFAITGFCCAEAYPLGPLQANEVASAETADNSIV